MTDPAMLCLQSLLGCAGDLFKDDPSRASVVISLLPGGEFYGSVVRYRAAYGEQREVVVKARSKLLDAVVLLLAENFLAVVMLTDLDELNGAHLVHQASALRESLLDG